MLGTQWHVRGLNIAHLTSLWVVARISGLGISYNQYGIYRRTFPAHVNAHCVPPFRHRYLLRLQDHARQASTESVWGKAGMDPSRVCWNGEIHVTCL